MKGPTWRVAFILLLALASLVAAWAWGEVARQRRRVEASEKALKENLRRMSIERKAYRDEKERLARLLESSSPAERARMATAILRELATGETNGD